MPDEQSVTADRALGVADRSDVIVPSIFWNEVRNICLVNERRGRITSDNTATAIATIAAFDALIDDASPHGSVLILARKHNLTAYDAAYLALAVKEKAVLATLDNRLARAGIVEGLLVISDVN